MAEKMPEKMPNKTTSVEFDQDKSGWKCNKNVSERHRLHILERNLDLPFNFQLRYVVPDNRKGVI